MKVIHLLPTNTFSGAENVVCQIINLFDGEIDMVYVSPDGSISKSVKDRGARFIPLKKHSYRYLKKIVKEEKPDIIHAHDVKSSILASFFSSKCRIISTIHVNSPAMSRTSLKSILYKICSKRIEKIIFVSQTSLDCYRYKKNVERKSLVLNNVINPKTLYMRSKEYETPQYDVIYLGRLEPQKNPLRVLDVCNLVSSKKHLSFKVCVVGDGSLKEEFTNRIKELFLENIVDYIGYSNNPYPYLSNSKILLMTSLFEGTPMCVLEAMSFGKVVVSTPTDGIVRLVNNDSGFISDDSDEIAEELYKLITNDNYYSDKSRRSKQSFDAFNNIDEYKEILKNIYVGI